jgi:hypothetical protein
LKESPRLVQIGDVITFKIKEIICHFKVIGLTVEQQRRDYQKRILDISEERSKVIKGLEPANVDEVSFNEHYSYLLHS